VLLMGAVRYKHFRISLYKRRRGYDGPQTGESSPVAGVDHGEIGPDLAIRNGHRQLLLHSGEQGFPRHPESPTKTQTSARAGQNAVAFDG